MSSKKHENLCDSPIFTWNSSNIFTGLFPQPQSIQNDILKQNKDPISIENDEQFCHQPRNSRDIRGSKCEYISKRKAIFKHDDGKKIFTYVSPQRGQKGNKNLVKFLIKCYFARFGEFVSPLNVSFHHYAEILREEIYSSGRKNIKLEHLKQIVGEKFSDKKFHNYNRMVFHHILSSASIRKSDIVQSNFIKNKVDKKQMLVATKVYNLRLRHFSLINRLQSR